MEGKSGGKQFSPSFLFNYSLAHPQTAETRGEMRQRQVEMRERNSEPAERRLGEHNIKGRGSSGTVSACAHLNFRHCFSL